MRTEFRLFTLAGLLLLAACGLPRSGPSKGELQASSVANGGDVHVVDVTSAIALAATRDQSMYFGEEFVNAGSRGVDIINPGDVLTVTVWENTDNGLLANVGQKVTFLQEVQVDQKGMIFIPYAGNLRAADKTPDQLRLLITRALEAQTPDPQVEIKRTAGDGAAVSVIGGVAAQGVYPIEAPTRRLTGMLAQAGGITIPQEIAMVTIRRGSTSGTIWLQDLYDNSALDVALIPGDKIIVEEDQRMYTALGSSGSQTNIPFARQELSVVQALAQVGGLRDNAADPSGVFVFREEPPEIANRVLGRSDIRVVQRFAYVINLTDPAGIFVAREFKVRDGDTLYITEAPFVGFQKVLNAFLTTVNSTESLATATNALN
jgi:polysaccharide export outer membrane protein